MRIEIEHHFTSSGSTLNPITDPGDYRRSLSGERWTFNVGTGHGYSDVVLKLDCYEVLGRPTPRHRFKVQKRWSAMDERSYHSQIRREDVPVPLSVQHEAADKVSIIFVPLEGMKRAEVGPLGGKLN